jgi:transcriptional regulator GlxA family with amidase domain
MLCSADAYLQHARLVNDVRAAPANAGLNDAACALLLKMVCERRERRLLGERLRTIHEIQELLNQSLAKPVSLPELSARFYLSPFTISRCFHRDTGLSLRRYIQSLRLRRALTFMLDEKRNLTAIALELGFYDEPHFSKAFHAEFGTTPFMALKAFAETGRSSSR